MIRTVSKTVATFATVPGFINKKGRSVSGLSVRVVMPRGRTYTAIALRSFLIALTSS